MKALKRYCAVLFFLLIVSGAQADIPKVLHVAKVKIKVDNKTFITYALIQGEFPGENPDSLLLYKTNSQRFKEAVNYHMRLYQHDTISLYSRIFRIKEHELVLLPDDKETKIPLTQIQEMKLIDYVPSYYAGPMIHTEILSADSTWLSWKIAHTEDVVQQEEMCGYTALFFNKPDDASRAVIKQAGVVLGALYSGKHPATKKEIDAMRKKLRKHRIIVFGMCSC